MGSESDSNRTPRPTWGRSEPAAGRVGGRGDAGFLSHPTRSVHGGRGGRSRLLPPRSASAPTGASTWTIEWPGRTSRRSSPDGQPSTNPGCGRGRGRRTERCTGGWSTRSRPSTRSSRTSPDAAWRRPPCSAGSRRAAGAIAPTTDAATGSTTSRSHPLRRTPCRSGRLTSAPSAWASCGDSARRASGSCTGSCTCTATGSTGDEPSRPSATCSATRSARDAAAESSAGSTRRSTGDRPHPVRRLRSPGRAARPGPGATPTAARRPRTRSSPTRPSAGPAGPGPGGTPTPLATAQAGRRRFGSAPVSSPEGPFRCRVHHPAAATMAALSVQLARSGR